MKKSRKAQMEIFGLVVIVLLVSLGMFFVIRFVMFSEEDDVLGGYSQTQAAANLLSTLRRTTTNCDSLSIEELIQACQKNPSKECSGDRVCDYVEDTITTLLDQTLEIWSRPYVFKMYISRSNPLIEKTHASPRIVCNETLPGDLKQEYISTQSGIVTLELKMCDSYTLSQQEIENLQAAAP